MLPVIAAVGEEGEQNNAAIKNVTTQCRRFFSNSPNITHITFNYNYFFAQD